jgi:negative regulator of sigma E activity
MMTVLGVRLTVSVRPWLTIVSRVGVADLTFPAIIWGCTPVVASEHAAGDGVGAAADSL